jgi:hypothetical protein
VSGLVRALCLTTLALGVAVQPGAAQSSGPKDSRTIWDGVYTQGQAELGQALAQRACMICHTQGEWTTPTFLGMWENRPLRGLYDTIRLTMPLDFPGQFSREEYADLMAYLLRLNDLPAGADALPGDDEALELIYITSDSP